MSNTSRNNYTGFLKVFAPVALSVFTVTACSFNLSTATLENAKMCGDVAEGKQCANDTKTFEKTAPKLFVTSDLKFAPSGTKVKIDWKYLGGEAGKASDIDSITLETKSDTTFVTSSLSAPNNGWPSGNYEVVLSLNTDNSQPIRKQFTIAGASPTSPSSSNPASPTPTNATPANTTSASFENIKMCNELTSDELCDRDITTFKKDTPKLFVSTNLKDIPVGSKLKFSWRLIEGEAGKEIDIDSATFEITNPNINIAHSSLSIPNQGWPAGTYEVVLSLDGNASFQPIRKQFSIAASQ